MFLNISGTFNFICLFNFGLWLWFWILVWFICVLKMSHIRIDVFDTLRSMIKISPITNFDEFSFVFGLNNFLRFVMGSKNFTFNVLREEFTFRYRTVVGFVEVSIFYWYHLLLYYILIFLIIFKPGDWKLVFSPSL